MTAEPIFGRLKMSNKLTPPHPGEILMEEFLKPMYFSQNQIANDWGYLPGVLMRLFLEKDALLPILP